MLINPPVSAALLSAMLEVIPQIQHPNQDLAMERGPSSFLLRYRPLMFSGLAEHVPCSWCYLRAQIKSTFCHQKAGCETCSTNRCLTQGLKPPNR